MILILMPVTIICLVNSEHIVSLIYKRGAFDKASVITTSRAFIGYIIGILFIAFRDIFIQVLYAFQKTKEAMINGIAGVAINIIFSLLLSRFYGVFGITIADSIAYIAVVFIGFSMTIEVLPEVKNILNRKEVVDFFLAGVLSFILGLIVKGFVQDIQVYLGMIINVISILIMYIAILLLTKNSAIGMVWSLIRR